jgi:diaminopimelate epimerase
MMKLKFTKMHGAGNDFVVIDGVHREVYLTAEQIRLLADRHFGVGCDQILLVERSQNDEADFRYRIFNADGGEVEQCGNGARCFVRFVHDHKLTSKREIVVETKSGLISPRLEDDGRVTVNMGAPVFEAARIPFTSDSDAIIQPLDVNG